jgi:hypothetical protein
MSGVEILAHGMLKYQEEYKDITRKEGGFDVLHSAPTIAKYNFYII